MVFPATKDFQIAARKTFPDKTALLSQRNGGPVSWLNIGFKPMELQFVESVNQHKLHTLVHQALARMRRKAVISEEGIVKGTTNQAIEIDHPNDVTSVAVNDQKAPMGF